MKSYASLKRKSSQMSSDIPELNDSENNLLENVFPKSELESMDSIQRFNLFRILMLIYQQFEIKTNDLKMQ